jgi:hypothetical protein
MRIASLQTENGGKWGFFPAAAAAPTDPSFRDNCLNGQWIKFSRKFLPEGQPPLKPDLLRLSDSGQSE